MKALKNILILILLLSSETSKSQGVELIKSFIGNTQKSEIISFTPQDEILISGDFSGYINYWDVPNQALINSIKAHNGKINRIEFSENGEYFLTFSKQDKHVKVWSFSGQDTLIDYTLKSRPHFAIFYDENSVLIGEESGAIYHRNFFTPERDSLLYKNSITAYDAIYNKRDNLLVLTDERSIKIIDLNNHDNIDFEIKNPYSSYFVKSKYYSPEVLMTWSKNGIVSFWDLKTKKIIRELRSKNDFHDNDKALLFDLTNLDLERELDENIQLVNTYLTNESNQFMISSSEEGRHRLMQVKGGDGIKPLSLQKREIEIQKIITVDTETLNIADWDNDRVDGDKISLSLNGRWILRNHEIVKEKYEFEINLIQNQINQLVFFAENLGSIPPNTSAVNIQYEGYNKTHIMRSNLDKSGCINFFIEK